MSNLIETMQSHGAYDWCEPNYVYSEYVAEFWNSSSSLIYCALGLFGLYTAITEKHEKRFLVAHVGLIAIGLGSFMFHATLTYYGQILDELPMIWLMLTLAYLMFSTDGTRYELHKENPFLASGAFPATLAAFGALYTAFYLFVPFYFYVLLVSFFILVLSLGYYTQQAVSELPDLMMKSAGVYPVDDTTRAIAALRRLFEFGRSAVIVAFTCWVLSEATCSRTQPMQLHAWWHLLSACAGYAWITFLHVHRWERRVERASLNDEAQFAVMLTAV